MKNKSIIISIAVLVAMIVAIIVGACFISPSEDDTSTSILDMSLDESTTISETTTKEILGDGKNSKLAQSCQKIVCSGGSASEYYEMVAQLEESYNGSELQIGIIKNGEWLREFSNDFPWINDKCWDADGSDFDSLSCKYAGNGVFEKEYNFGISFLKSETLKEVKFCTGVNEEYSGYSINTPSDHEYYGIQGAMLIENDYQIITANKAGVGINCANYVTFILDTKTMEYKTFELKRVQASSSYCNYQSSFDSNSCSQVYDGVFWSNYDIKTGKEICTLYDVNGDEVFNTENITSDTSKIYYLGTYENGTCIIRTVLGSGSKFELTLDKEGNILSQKKIS